MKIAYFLDIPKRIGGAGNLLLQQAALMAELYDVIVVIPTDENGDPNQEYESRCRRLHLVCTGMRFYTSFNFGNIDYSNAMKSVPLIEEFVQKENVTFFHSVQLNIAVEYVSRKLKIPHLMNIYQLKRNEFKLCPANIYAQYHMCDSVMYSDLWKQQLGICSKCVRPLAIQEEIKRKAKYPKDKFKFLMLGDICERKNQLTAIRSIEQCLLTKDLELHLAGYSDCVYVEKCALYVEEHELKQKVIFHGFLKDITPLLEECDCLLCTSTDESFPSSMVEALTYDMTIISTPIAGVPELFIDGYNSFISSDFTVESIRDCILNCVQCYADGKIAAVHENALKTWQNHFSAKTVRKQIDRYYKEIQKNSNFKGIEIFYDIGKNVEYMEMLLQGMDAEDNEWIYSRCMYYGLLKEKLYGGEIYIWGAGKMGRLTARILQRIVPDATITAFIDTYKEGWYCGIPIIKPERVPIDKKAFYCISFIENNAVVIHGLEEKGLELNTQIWLMP